MTDDNEHQAEHLADLIFESLIFNMKEAKVEITRNGPDDLPPRIIYVPEQKMQIVMIQPVVVGDDVPVPEIVFFTIHKAAEELGPPGLIAVASEAWMQMFEQHADISGLQRGDISRDPTSTECLSIAVTHRKKNGNLREMYTSIPFHYADGSVVFGDAYTVDSDRDGEGMKAGGAITDVINALFGMRGN